MMYGVPGTTNAVEATTNLAPAEWHELERLLVSGRAMILNRTRDQRAAAVLPHQAGLAVTFLIGK